VKAVFTTAGTLGPVGIKGWLLGELPDPIKVKGDPSPMTLLKKFAVAVLIAAAEVVLSGPTKSKVKR